MSEYKKVVNIIRKFNRFYTVNMGFLSSNYLNSDYSVAETRILFEIKMNKICTQSAIVKVLGIDKSYLSRIVQRLCMRELIKKTKSEGDKRTTNIMLTAMGDKETDRLIELTNSYIETKVVGLNSEECNRLAMAFETIISILGKEVN